jgi:hypothetical protein
VIQDAILEPIIGTDRWPLLWNEWKHFGMLDAGIANPTAFLLGCYDKEGRIIIYAEHYKQGLTVKENAYEIKSLMEQLQVTNKIEYMVADPAIRNKDPIVGYSIQMAYGQEGLYFALGNNDVIAGISRVYQRFQNKQLFITKDCPKTVWEHTRYRWQSYANKKTEIKNNPKEAPMKKNDHACDALRYGVVSRPSIDGEIDMPKELVLNGSVAVSPVNPLFDTNLTRMGKTMKLNDPHLGSDW